MIDDPRVAAYLRQMEDKTSRVQSQMRSMVERYKTLAQEREDDKIELGKLKKALKKAAERIRYIEDIPGKRVPYFLTFKVDVPGQSNPSVPLAGSRISDVKQVSMDGPFVATSYMSAFQLKTFSLGPYADPQEGSGRPNDPPAGTEVVTPLTGRFRPVASTADPFSGAYIGPGIGGIQAASSISAAQAVQTFRPGVADFLFEVADEGVDRQRQNAIPVPSRYLYSEFDRPLYLPVSDFFERGSSIKFTATLTRDLGFAEINYATLPNGFTEGALNPPPDPILNDPPLSGRAVVALGGVLYFTMLGYKILQAQSPAV